MKKIICFVLLSFFTLVHADNQIDQGVTLGSILDKFSYCLDKFEQDRLKFDGILVKTGLKPKLENDLVAVDDVNIED